MSTNLDLKIKEVFPDESVYKIKENYSVFAGKNIPAFIRDWLIKKFTDSDGVLDKDLLTNFLTKHISYKGLDIKGELLRTKEESTLLTRILVEPDIKNEIFRFSIPDLGIKFNEGRVPLHLIKKHDELVSGEVWGVFKLAHFSPIGKEPAYIGITDYRPFKPYEVDLEYFKEGRKKFSLGEWVDLLIRSMEYNPAGFKSFSQKLTFLSRLLIFVEPRLNMIELAPKGTGKSYIFNNLSKYGWSVSGGTVTRAKMFYDISRKSFGFIMNYDFVAMDEVQTIRFSNDDELKGALKNYLESGIFTVGNVKGISNAGLILLGNIKLSAKHRPLNDYYLENLPEFFQESALLDRFHGFIEGWYLPRINESMKVRGYTLNVEYFSEIAHLLRECNEFPMIVDELLDIPPKADTRDVTAVKRLASAYLKLLFPHVVSPDDLKKDEFERHCLNPAMEKRGIIRKQCYLMDPEFKVELPEIRVRRN